MIGGVVPVRASQRDRLVAVLDDKGAGAAEVAGAVGECHALSSAAALDPG